MRISNLPSEQASIYNDVKLGLSMIRVRYTQHKNYDFLDKDYDSCPIHLNHREKYFEVWKDYVLNQV